MRGEAPSGAGYEDDVAAGGSEALLVMHEEDVEKQSRDVEVVPGAETETHCAMVVGHTDCAETQKADLITGSFAQSAKSPDVSRSPSLRRTSLQGGSGRRKSLSLDGPRRASWGCISGVPPPSVAFRRSSLGQMSVNLHEVFDQAGESLGSLLLPERPVQAREIELTNFKTSTEQPPDTCSFASSASFSNSSTVDHDSLRDLLQMASQFFCSPLRTIKSCTATIRTIPLALKGKNRIYWDDFGLSARAQALACFIGAAGMLAVMVLFVAQGRNTTPEERAAALKEQREHMENRARRRGRLGILLKHAFNHSTADFEGRDLFGSHINTQGDTRALGIVFWTSIVACGVIFILFTRFKQQWPQLYYGRKAEDGCAMARSYAQVSHRVRDKEADKIIERAGLDAWMLLQYYKMNCRMFGLIGSINILVLCPLHFVSGPSVLPSLTSISIINLPDFSWVFWVHAVIVFVVVVVASEMVHKEHQLFLKFRFSWLIALPRPQATTLMVQNIPEEFRSDKALQNYFAQFEFQTSAVESAYMVRRTEHMKELVKLKKKAEDNLLQQRRIWEKDQRKHGIEAVRPTVIVDGTEVDLIKECEVAVTQAEMALGDVQEHIEADALTMQPTLTASARVSSCQNADSAGRISAASAFSESGFVTFSSRHVAMSAAQRQYRANPREFHVEFAPEPSDVRYEELAKTRVRGLIKDIVGTLCLLVVFINCAPVVLLITSITSVESLCERWPWLQDYMQGSGVGQAFLTGLLGTGLLKIFQQFLPKILLLIINRFFSLKAGTRSQLILQKWYYCYQLLFVVLATAIGASLVSAVVEVIDDPSVIFVVLAETLPDTSDTYLNFVVLSCAVVCLEILRLARVVKYNMFRVVMPKQQAYERAQVEDLAFTGMGSRMTKAVTMTTVVLLYCCCAPLICFFGYIYFFIGRSVFSFLFRYAEGRKADLGGAFWVQAIDHFFIAISLFLMFMVGILGTRCASLWPALIAGSSMIILIQRWRFCRTCIWEQLPCDEVLKLDKHAESESASNVRIGEYIQPECKRRAFQV